jgi:hypothetical protein
MSNDHELTRRGFLDATAKACGLAVLGGAASAPTAEGAEASLPAAPAQAESPRAPKGNWPQEYTVERDEAAGRLVLSTPYYAVTHDLKRGGAISEIRYTHGAAPNLLLQPLGASVQLAAQKASHHFTLQEGGPPPTVLSDLHDSSPAVSVVKSGKRETVTIEAALRAPKAQDLGLRTRTTYEYRWGYIKIHKEFVFPAAGARAAGLTVLSTVLHPTLTHHGHRPAVFEYSDVDPFGIEKVRWGRTRPGNYFDTEMATRYVPRYLVLANPGIEGIEWFVGDEWAQWDYQITGRPGSSSAAISVSLNPLGVGLNISPLSLPSSPDLERGGFVNLQGAYSFDYYLAMPILEGHASKRWLERSFGPNRGQWVSDDEIRRNAEAGIVTMTLHNDGDGNGDGLFWRDGAYPPYPPEEMKKMEHVLKICHEHGIKTLPYFSNHELHQSTAAFQQHGEEWARKPDDQGNLRPDYFYGAHMCFKSGWLDYFKSYVDTVLKHQAFDGIYYDWNCALYCNNPRHLDKDSSGVTSEEGLATYACSKTGHWDMDELLDLMEWTRERVGPEGLVTVHNTMVPMFAVENFADYVVGMEWGYGALLTGVPRPADLPLEWNFAGARSRADIEYGSVAENAPARVHRLFHLTTLLTGTAPWPASYEAAELFKILKPLGDLERYQFEDGRNRAVKLPPGEDLLSAVYSRPGEAYILLANLQPIAREIVCRIDARTFRNPMPAARSAAILDVGQTVPLDVLELPKRGEKILLPAEGVKLLHLTA